MPPEADLTPEDNTAPIREAIQKFLESKGSEDIVTGFVVVFETDSIDSGRSLHALYPDNQPSWQTEGYLHKTIDYGVEPDMDWGKDE